MGLYLPTLELFRERLLRREFFDPFCGSSNAAARELRDRYLEQFNSGLVLPCGKYEVSRALPSPQPTPGVPGEREKLLPRAA